MPPEPHCQCGGSGLDGCPPEDTVPYDDFAERLRDGLALDAERPLGIRGGLLTDRTSNLVADLDRREPAGRLSKGVPAGEPRSITPTALAALPQSTLTHKVLNRTATPKEGSRG